MIKAKDPRLASIDITILRFLIGPPPKVTQDVELIAQQVVDIFQAKEEVIPSGKEPERQVRAPIYIDLGEDFEVFNQPNLAKHF